MSTHDKTADLIDRMVNPNLPDHLKRIATALQNEAMIAFNDSPDDIDVMFGVMHLVQAKDCLIRARVAKQ